MGSSTATASPAKQVLSAFSQAGFDHATGVPCSLLSGFFAELETSSPPLHFTPAMREDTALGLATGMTLAGGRPLVLMQNSGLGYSLNVLTSLAMIYNIGLTLVVSWRGHGVDAVEHDIIGAELTNLLDLFSIEWQVLDIRNLDSSIEQFLSRAHDRTRTRALIVTEGFSHA
jgi:sulfopyruvate decarboxylase subunit alpha